MNEFKAQELPDIFTRGIKLICLFEKLEYEHIMFKCYTDIDSPDYLCNLITVKMIHKGEETGHVLILKVHYERS